MNGPIERVWHRVLMLVGRARITAVNDSGRAQVVQVKLSADEIKDGTPRLAEYGFQSNPPVGSDAIVLFLAGERTNGVVIACGNQTYRLTGLATGEVAISDNRGQKVYLSAAGICIDGGGLPMQITNAPSLLIDVATVQMTGALTVDGSINSGTNIVATGNIADQGGAKTMAGMRANFNPPRHGNSGPPAPLM